MTSLALACENVGKSYGGREVLAGVDIAVPTGGFYGLVGMNGSGKSTLIKAMLELVSVDKGQISIFGRPHRRVSARAEIAYLPDRFSPPIHLKCTDFIQYMLKLHASRKSGQEIRDMLDALELDQEKMESSVRSLSKGMTQKLGLASCLLSNKALLMLDEPMSGLDPKARVLLKQQLFELKRQGVTLFFSSHMLTDVDELADRMAVLHKSRILFEGTTADFKHKFNGSTLEQAYMTCIASNGSR